MLSFQRSQSHKNKNMKPSKSFFLSRNRYTNAFRDSGGLEKQSVQELEVYAAYKSEETTKAVKSCLKVAECIREDAAKTLVTLHQQGEQITRTHEVAADMDHNLSKTEKLLGRLGGIFSRWKPKKTSPINGPVITRDDASHKRVNHIDQREKLGLLSKSKGQSSMQTPHPKLVDTMHKIEEEKAKQDDTLSEICCVLGDIKKMAIDMGLEFDRQNEALRRVHDDVDVLNYRVSLTNRRARYLLRK